MSAGQAVSESVRVPPTVLVLGADGVIERRSSGQQRRADLLAAVGAVLGEEGDS